MWKDAFGDVKTLLRLESRDSGVQELARRINARVSEINDQQHTTSQLIEDMLTALEDPSTSQEKINKVSSRISRSFRDR